MFHFLLCDTQSHTVTRSHTQLNDSLAEMGLWGILIGLLGLFLFGCVFVYANLQQQTADGGSWRWSMGGAVAIVIRFLAS